MSDLEIDGIRLTRMGTDGGSAGDDAGKTVPGNDDCGITLAPMGMDDPRETVPEVSEPAEDLDIRLSAVVTVPDAAPSPAVPVFADTEVEPVIEPVVAVEEVPAVPPAVPPALPPAGSARQIPEKKVEKARPRRKFSFLKFFFILLLLAVGAGAVCWFKYQELTRSKLAEIKAFAVAKWQMLVGGSADAESPAEPETPAVQPAAPAAAANDIFSAARAGDQEWFVTLINQGAKVTGSDPDGNTILHCIAESGNSKLLIFVLQKWGNQLDINARNRQGDTPLHLAAAGGHMPVIRILRSKRAQLIRNNRGKLPADVSRDDNIRRIFRNW